MKNLKNLCMILLFTVANSISTKMTVEDFLYYLKNDNIVLKVWVTQPIKAEHNAFKALAAKIKTAHPEILNCVIPYKKGTAYKINPITGTSATDNALNTTAMLAQIILAGQGKERIFSRNLPIGKTIILEDTCQIVLTPTPNDYMKEGINPVLESIPTAIHECEKIRNNSVRTSYIPHYVTSLATTFLTLFIGNCVVKPDANNNNTNNAAKGAGMLIAGALVGAATYYGLDKWALLINENYWSKEIEKNPAFKLTVQVDQNNNVQPVPQQPTR